MATGSGLSTLSLRALPRREQPPGPGLHGSQQVGGTGLALGSTGLLRPGLLGSINCPIPCQQGPGLRPASAPWSRTPCAHYSLCFVFCTDGLGGTEEALKAITGLTVLKRLSPGVQVREVRGWGARLCPVPSGWPRGTPTWTSPTVHPSFTSGCRGQEGSWEQHQEVGLVTEPGEGSWTEPEAWLPGVRGCRPGRPPPQHSLCFQTPLHTLV